MFAIQRPPGFISSPQPYFLRSWPPRVAARPLGMTPARALHVAPPLEMVVQPHGVPGRREYHRARHVALARRPGELLRVGPGLRDRQVAGRLDEAPEVLVRDL